MTAGAAVMSMRQNGTNDTQVMKIGGEMFDQEGYRVDVTVWFRHRNEALYCKSSSCRIITRPLNVKMFFEHYSSGLGPGSFLKFLILFPNKKFCETNLHKSLVKSICSLLY